MPIELQSGVALRNCCRCGTDFRSDASSRICSDCRDLAATQKKPLKSKLSFREEQVVKLVSQAKLNKEIANELRLTEGTVKEYLNRIFRKIGASNRTELAVWALTQKMQAEA